MGQVGWIKVNTNIFSNRKIKILLKEREGDTYFRKSKILQILLENLRKHLRKSYKNLLI